ncbi:MAG: chromosomal replication initiator protein DnaA [Succinivibrio sp.]
MDFNQVWKDAITMMSDSFPDPTQKAVIQCIQTLCSFTVIDDSVCFICKNDAASKLLPQYAYNLLTIINNILGKNYGMQIKMSGDLPQNSPVPPRDMQANNYNMGYGRDTVSNMYQPGNPNQNYRMDFYSQDQYASYPEAAQTNVQTNVIPKYENDSINPDKTFDNYITDPENQLVYTIANSIADNPGSESYNPFYIYGGSGLGKTHLLWAIANKIRREKPNISVVYIRAEDFIRKYVDSMAKKNSYDPQQVHFQDMFTQHNVYIMDDIQSLTKADKARDTFFDIIATFLDKPGRQLILASDVPPGNLKNFSPRLVSRFGSGVCREIYPPSKETRAAITLRKCNEMHFELPREIVDYIAQNIRSSVREIEGAIKTLKVQVDMNNGVINYDDAVQILSNLVNVKSQLTTLDAIKQRVAEEYGVTIESMESAERKKLTSTARSIAMALASDLIPTLSLNEIARSFNKDHSSVHSAINRTRDRIKEDKELSAVYQKLTLSLKKD